MKKMKLVGMVLALVFAMMGCFSQEAGVNNATGTKKFAKRAFASNYPYMGLRGTFNQWSCTPMTLVANNVWQGTATFGATTSEAFKIDMNGDWVTNWGDNNGDKIADASGKNIPVAPSKAYTITFNDSTKAYTITEETATVYVNPQIIATNFTSNPSVGSMARGLKIDLYKNDLLVKTSIVDGTSILSATFSNLEKSTNYIVKVAEQIKNETDITLPVKGNVRYYNFDSTYVTTSATGTSTGPVLVDVRAELYDYAMSYDTMYFRGTPNAWGTTLMARVGDHTWATSSYFSTTSAAFKFDAYGNWTKDKNWGEVNADWTADVNGDNIKVNSFSVATIVFNDQNQKYQVIYKPSSSVYAWLSGNSNSFIIAKGDTTFKLPTDIGVNMEGYARSETATWTPALDVNKVGTTVYVAQYGITYFLTVR